MWFDPDAMQGARRGAVDPTQCEHCQGFQAARSVLAGLEFMPAIRKGQCPVEESETMSCADSFMS